MRVNNWNIFIAISVAFFLVSCASTAITPTKITKTGDKVIIDLKNYRITEKIASNEITENYLVYGVAGALGDCTALFHLMPYDRAKQLVQKYGSMKNCKSAGADEWMNSMYDVKCYALNSEVEATIKRIAELKGVPVIKMKYQKLELLEWAKKQGRQEIKYKEVTERYPHYLVTDIEIINEKFEVSKL
jgi:hypothetical protein